MENELSARAADAMRVAAERLGVDPCRLARFLSDGKLADVLLQLRSVGATDQDLVQLAESYLAFLDREIELSAGAKGRTQREA